MNGHVVGIIGATGTALAFARLVSSIGVDVAMADFADAGQLGERIHAVSVEQAADPEIVVLATEFSQVPRVLERVRNWDARILVDATMLPAVGDTSLMRRVVELTPGAQVIKALGSSPLSVFDRPLRWPGFRHAIFMCGDHFRAKRQFAALLERLSFLGIDLGSLEAGSRLLDPPDGALSSTALLAEARVI